MPCYCKAERAPGTCVSIQSSSGWGRLASCAIPARASAPSAPPHGLGRCACSARLPLAAQAAARAHSGPCRCVGIALLHRAACATLPFISLCVFCARARPELRSRAALCAPRAMPHGGRTFCGTRIAMRRGMLGMLHPPARAVRYGGLRGVHGAWRGVHALHAGSMALSAAGRSPFP